MSDTEQTVKEVPQEKQGSFTRKMAEYIQMISGKQFDIDVWPKTDLICLYDFNRSLALFPIDYNLKDLISTHKKDEPYTFDGDTVKKAIDILDSLRDTSFDVIRELGWPLLLRGEYFQISIAPLGSTINEEED